jgi:glucan phosphoethanolaminetransferase (alkaline phosphatase superfamily)
MVRAPAMTEPLRLPDAPGTRVPRQLRLGPRRSSARARRWLARAVVAVLPLAILGVDLTRRRTRLLSLDREDLFFYFLSATFGAVLWTMLVAAATRKRGIARWPLRIGITVLAILAVGSQLYTFERYGAYMNHRAVLVGTSFLPSIGQQLWFDRWNFLKALLPSIALATLVPVLARRLAPIRTPDRAWLCLDAAVAAALCALFVSPERGAEQGQPPDMMYVSAMGQLLRARWDHNETVERVHPGPRTPAAVPKLSPRPSRARNVVMIVTESVRAQSVCLDYAPDCKLTPFSNEAAPSRMALKQMRALDSTTAISLAVMWNGLLPTRTREEEHTAPLLWEFMQAAGLDSAYYTSQNLLFGNSGTWLEGQPWTRHVSATQLEPEASYEIGADDGKLTDFVVGDLPRLREPWLAVVHYSNTHFPYKVDPDDLPFTPQEEATGPGYEIEILNRYQDAIYAQDKAIGRLIRALRSRPDAERTVLVFISDHGEQMREKGAVGHTGTLFEQEIRIPFWIDAPQGALTEAEREHVRSLWQRPVTHLDVFPTILDLLGLWTAPEIEAHKRLVAGESLLRGGSPLDRPLVLTNCTELWACAFKNWGAIRGTRKLIAHQGESAWSCFDVASDPAEEHPLDPNACADLLPLAEGTTAGKRPF